LPLSVAGTCDEEATDDGAFATGTAFAGNAGLLIGSNRPSHFTGLGVEAHPPDIVSMSAKIVVPAIGL